MTMKKNSDGQIDELELLTELLRPYFPPENRNRVAKNLIAKFGSLYRVLLASESALSRVDGMTKSAAFYLPMQYKMFLRIRSEQEVVTEDTLYQFSQIAVNLAGGRNTEALYLALLDKSHRLCGCRLIIEGETNFVNIDMRKIYRAVTDYPDTQSVIFIHNHPSGIASPSLADLKETEWMANRLSPLGITIRDHIVVGNGQAFSFSASGLNAPRKNEMVIGPDGMPFFPEEIFDFEDLQ